MSTYNYWTAFGLSVSSGGDPIGTPAPILTRMSIATIQVVVEEEPLAVARGGGGSLAVWSESTGGDVYALRAARLSEDGRPLDPSPVAITPEEPGCAVAGGSRSRPLATLACAALALFVCRFRRGRSKA
jgi:hypothetical protein